MAEEKKEDDKKPLQPIIVKKIIQGGGHHGGAWKVAYADFVTAMMAFFLLLWLLNVATSEQLNSISNYFDPTHPKVSDSNSGAGGLLGGLSMAPQGAMATKVQELTAPNPLGQAGNEMKKEPKKNPDKGAKKSDDISKEAIEKAKEELRKAEEKKFQEIKDKIEKSIQATPELQSLAKNLIMDITPEGLRIQIVDQDGEPMFASGSAKMFEKTRMLMEKVASIVKETINQVSIRGHTDGVPYSAGADYTNWELSSDRANASRRVLKNSGIAAERLNDVVGKADTEHLFPDNPLDPRNRRISIMLLKEELTNKNFAKKAEEKAIEEANQTGETDEPAEGQDAEGGGGVPQVPIGTFRRTPGSVEFP